jgi:endonuclease YncB( thermonuclease family)
MGSIISCYCCKNTEEPVKEPIPIPIPVKVEDPVQVKEPVQDKAPVQHKEPIIDVVFVPSLVAARDFINNNRMLIKQYIKPPIKGLKLIGLVVAVYDGDTFTYNYVLDNQIHQTRIRIYGIDTPELRTKNEKEKELAIDAKNVLSDLILDKCVYVEIVGPDKYYGRMLGKVHVRGIGDLSTYMISKGHAVEYLGGKKLKFLE